MSVFNHMGKLIIVEGEWATYEYYPDYISHDSEFGVFKIKPSTLLLEDSIEYEITRKSGTVELWFNRTDEHVVFALMSKIRVSARAGNLFPERVYHIA